jgi:hypothetical protein
LMVGAPARGKQVEPLSTMTPIYIVVAGRGFWLYMALATVRSNLELARKAQLNWVCRITHAIFKLLRIFHAPHHLTIFNVGWVS